MGGMVGIDIGGTFTDFVIVDGAAEVRIHKRSSTPSDPSEAFIRGLHEALVDIAGLDKAVHGTTVGTNSLIERRGATTRASVENAMSATSSSSRRCRTNSRRPLFT